MEITYLILAFTQSLAVSLGVGSSTLAVVNYIVAVRDNNMDQSERRLMGVVYTILRIAMIAILLTMVGQALLVYIATGTYALYPFILAAWTVVLVLFANAILMTIHRMPRFLGPALQAGSWYMLAVLYFFSTIGLVGLSYTQFFTMYLAIVIVAILAINGTLAYFKTKV
ncbi:MAG: hypothetical protein WDZ93_03520 [Candidatus Paceibacterota bacterium]